MLVVVVVLLGAECDALQRADEERVEGVRRAIDGGGRFGGGGGGGGGFRGRDGGGGRIGWEGGGGFERAFVRCCSFGDDRLFRLGPGSSSRAGRSQG